MHCQIDRERELISRPELRQTDRHADEAKTDATETAVTGHLRPTGRRWPVASSESSTFDESARRSVCRNSGRESERAIWPDRVLFSGSVAKPCAKVLRSHAHSPPLFRRSAAPVASLTSRHVAKWHSDGRHIGTVTVHVLWLCSVFTSSV